MGQRTRVKTTGGGEDADPLERGAAGAAGGLLVKVRRIYEPVDADRDGYRVLVDRLWPRGLRRADTAFDAWMKDVAPSTELRRWYGHESSRFTEFARRYRTELARPPASEPADRLRQAARAGPITLLTATRVIERSGAYVLRGHLLDEVGQ
jgi:uncharacterized protein YeaO (DUF488 family)